MHSLTVFVATTRAQGQRANDFAYVDDSHGPRQDSTESPLLTAVEEDA